MSPSRPLIRRATTDLAPRRVDLRVSSLKPWRAPMQGRDTGSRSQRCREYAQPEDREMTDFLRSIGDTSGEWAGLNGKVAKWAIRDGALMVSDDDDKLLALIPLDAIVAALRILRR